MGHPTGTAVPLNMRVNPSEQEDHTIEMRSDKIGAMISPVVHRSTLKLLPAYTGCTTLDEALADSRQHAILWLEVLFNDQLDQAELMRQPKGREAFDIACRWYTQLRSVIQYIAPRSPLPPNDGPLDYRHYRTFIDALHFVSPDA